MRLYDYPASPNCFKARLALAELDVDYERTNVDIFGGDTLTEEFGAINPDIGLYGYLHAAGDAGVDLSRFPSLESWIERVRSRPRHVADLMPIPETARVGQGRSIYDVMGI